MFSSSAVSKTRLGIAITVFLLLGGCATSRGVVNLDSKQVANPTTGTPVKIVSVTDKRVFQIKPPEPSIPSLKDDDIGNKALTARAIGRKRNGFGMALGDVLLAEGQSVAGLTQDALTRAFRESGYRVLQPTDAGYAEAAGVSAEINQFWSWVTPGFWAITLETKISLRLTGEKGVFDQPTVVEGYAKRGFQFIAGDDWINMTQKGLDDMVTNMHGKLGGK